MLDELLEIRADPKLWFQGFGRFRDEKTRLPTRGRANILQRRMFEHYRRCQAAGKPCRMVVLKYRRAGSSTASEAMLYTHAHNYHARLGVIGTDYKASANMLQMLEFFGEHDDFPGWSDPVAVSAGFSLGSEDWSGDEALEVRPWEKRVENIIATKITWTHGSSAELYTAGNPESARSAGLNGYHATEVGRWPSGGEFDAIETLSSMRNALPKTGFHLAIEESTANGAQGAFHDTCRAARWPAYAEWWKQWATDWPLTEGDFPDLQPVFIFAAWFEDDRNVYPLTPEQAWHVEGTLDAEPWYLGEKALIARYGTQGPKGLRLGGEVSASVWEQLAFRRSIIRDVCTRRGLDEFAQEYPSNPLEAFRVSGAPVFDHVGITALDEMARAAPRAECGVIDDQRGGSAGFRRTAEAEEHLQVWEHPIPGRRYLISVDPAKSAEIIRGTGERDRHAVLVLRDAFIDARGRSHNTRLAARVKPPNQWEDAPLARLIAGLARYYGGAITVVESNLGPGLITRLRDEHRCNLYVRQHWDAVRQTFGFTYGWTTDAETRRQAVSVLQEFIREKRLEAACPNVIAELKTFVFNSKGRAEAASGAHDDDVMALAIGLTCLPQATGYPVPPPVSARPVDEHLWVEE